MEHKLSCSCGAVNGTITIPKVFNRVICYCKDCQAFAHHLGAADRVLDDKGGTDIIQMPSAALSFDTGIEHVKCLRLSPKGLFRWYAACCNTPLSNILPNPKSAFIGILTTVLEAERLNADFGRITCVYKGNSAVGEAKPGDYGLVRTILTALQIILIGRLNGTYRQSPYLKDETFIAQPQVLTKAQRESATPA